MKRSRHYYVVITQHVVGAGPWETVYSCDGEVFAGRSEALAHGWRVLGHDDFNIGTVDDGRLVKFGWGDWDFGDPGHESEDGAPHGGYDLAKIQRQTGDWS